MSQSFIDKYEIVSTIGRGSMGVVYKAKDPEIGRLVAIKTLKSVYMGDDTAGNEALQRFRQESRSAGKLHHPNIVTIFEAGRASNGSPFIVMEFVEGKSLEAMISENGALDSLAVLHYLSQIANAIDYAHAQDVIHRDIKPSNIIIDTKHKPFLLDFGVAKLSDTSLTPAGTVVGTPSYMSPEQIRGTELDGRSDIFSLAVVAFETLTGKRPFPGNDFTTVVSSIINKEPLSFKEVESNLPAALERVLDRGMSKDKTQRQQSALELIDEAAQTLGVVIDGNGLVGGYYPGMLVEDHQKSSNLSQRVKAKTVIGSFNADSLGLKAALQHTNQKKDSSNDQDVIATSAFNAEKIAEKKEIPSESKYKKAAVDYAAAANENLTQKSNPAVKIFFGAVIVILVMLGIVTSNSKLTNKIFGSNEQKVDSEISKETAEEVVSEKENIKAESLKEGSSSEAMEISDKEQQVPPTKEVENTKEKLEVKKVELPAGPFNAEQISSLSNEQIALLFSEHSEDKEALRLAIPEVLKREKADLLPLALKNADYKIRIDTLKAISFLEKKSRELLTPEVINSLSDTEFLVRGFAVKVLAQIKTTEAIAALEARQAVEKNQIVLKVLNDTISQIKNNNATKE